MPSFSTRNQQQPLRSDRSDVSLPPKEYPPMRLDQEMPFGKFKGCKVKDIILKKKTKTSWVDGGAYIQWALENITGFSLDDEAQTFFEANHEPVELKKKGNADGSTFRARH